eukprot:tig00000042_g15414.t1
MLDYELERVRERIQDKERRIEERRRLYVDFIAQRQAWSREAQKGILLQSDHTRSAEFSRRPQSSPGTRRS